MVQHVNEGVNVSLLPHGNAKSTDEYIRMKASTLKKVKDSANLSTASNVYNAVFNTSRGILDAASMGSFAKEQTASQQCKISGQINGRAECEGYPLYNHAKVQTGRIDC